MPAETGGDALAPSDVRHPESAGSRIGGRVLLGAAIVYFLASLAVFTIPRADDILDTPARQVDFTVFYAASSLIVRGEGSELYKARNAKVPGRFKIATGNYFNPPLLAMVLSPLTALTEEQARAVFVMLMLAAALGAVAVTPGVRRSAPLAATAILAMATWLPAQESLHLGQPSVLYAFITVAALSALLSGKHVTGGWIASLLVMKPSLAVAPLGLVAFIGNRRATTAVVSGVLVFGAAPFLILGLGAVGDFLRLLSTSRSDAFSYEGGITAGAKYMFNWNGFVARLFQTDPSPVAVFPLYLVTALLVVKVWSMGDIGAGWLAATIGTLLAIPHMLFYDWAILLPVALVFLSQRRTLAWAALLLVVHLCVNLSMVEVLNGAQNRAFVVATPAAFLLLLALAFEPQLRWLNRWRLWESGTVISKAASPSQRAKAGSGA